jgi:hypothetical protein
MHLEKKTVGRLVLVLALLVPICFIADSDLGAADYPEYFLEEGKCTAGGPGSTSCSYESCSKSNCSDGKYPCCGPDVCECVSEEVLLEN